MGLPLYRTPKPEGAEGAEGAGDAEDVEMATAPNIPERVDDDPSPSARPPINPPATRASINPIDLTAPSEYGSSISDTAHLFPEYAPGSMDVAAQSNHNYGYGRYQAAPTPLPEHASLFGPHLESDTARDRAGRAASPQPYTSSSSSQQGMESAADCDTQPAADGPQFPARLPPRSPDSWLEGESTRDRGARERIVRTSDYEFPMHRISRTGRGYIYYPAYVPAPGAMVEESASITRARARIRSLSPQDPCP